MKIGKTCWGVIGFTGGNIGKWKTRRHRVNCCRGNIAEKRKKYSVVPVIFRDFLERRGGNLFWGVYTSHVMSVRKLSEHNSVRSMSGEH